jgi:hypothetical protein
VDKLTESRTEDQQRIRELSARVLAPQAGIADPRAAADAASLLDWKDLDPTDETSVLKALKDLVKDRPYLAGNVGGGADGGQGGSRGQETSDMNVRIRQAAGRA